MPEGRRALRVVSQVNRLKGKIEAFGCGDDGRSRIRLLRRHRSDANRAFERAARGNVLILPATDELSSDDSVERVELEPKS